MWQDNWFSILILFASFQGLLLSIAIIQKRKTQSNKLLSVFIGLVSLLLFGRYFYSNPNLSLLQYKAMFLGDTVVFLYGPLLYIYIKLIFKNQNGKNVLLHFVPAFLFSLFVFRFLFADVEAFRSQRNLLTIGFQIAEISAICLNVFYLALCIKIFLGSGLDHLNIYSFSKKYSFHSILLIVNVLTIIFWILTFVMKKWYYPIFDNYLGYHLVWMILTLAIISLGYYSLIKPKFLEFTIQSFSKPKNYPLSEDLELISLKLEHFIKNERPYLNPQLNIKHLAESINVQPYILSKVLNEKMNMHFFDFINVYRVEAFKRRVREGELENRTILALAIDSGFNSKTTFNKAFKKFNGYTPLHFIRTEVKKNISKV